MARNPFFSQAAGKPWNARIVRAQGRTSTKPAASPLPTRTTPITGHVVSSQLPGPHPNNPPTNLPSNVTPGRPPSAPAVTPLPSQSAPASAASSTTTTSAPAAAPFLTPAQQNALDNWNAQYGGDLLNLNQADTDAWNTFNQSEADLNLKTAQSQQAANENAAARGVFQSSIHDNALNDIAVTSAMQDNILRTNRDSTLSHDTTSRQTLGGENTNNQNYYAGLAITNAQNVPPDTSTTITPTPHPTVTPTPVPSTTVNDNGPWVATPHAPPLLHPAAPNPHIGVVGTSLPGPALRPPGAKASAQQRMPKPPSLKGPSLGSFSSSTPVRVPR